MSFYKKYPFSFVAMFLGALVLVACSGTTPKTQQPATMPAQKTPVQGAPVATTISATAKVPAPAIQATQENPLAPETNPVGDIPDTQVFVSYTAPTGSYTLDVPEGWARTTNGTGVSFSDKFDGLSVTLTTAASAPTSDSVRQNEVAVLTKAGHAFQVGQVTEVDLPGGHAVRITATVNSDPDPVTGKQVRLEEDIYLFFHNGTEAILQLWAPQGADNVDQWKRISESFRWK